MNPKCITTHAIKRYNVPTWPLATLDNTFKFNSEEAKYLKQKILGHARTRSEAQGYFYLGEWHSLPAMAGQDADVLLILRL